MPKQPDDAPLTAMTLLQHQLDLLLRQERLLDRISRRLGVIELILILWFVGSIFGVVGTIAVFLNAFARDVQPRVPARPTISAPAVQETETIDIVTAEVPSEKPRRSVGTTTSPYMMPSVVAFLEKHEEFGMAKMSTSPSKSMMATKQRIEFDTGKTLIFHEQEGVITRVYEDGPKGPVRVWGLSTVGSEP